MKSQPPIVVSTRDLDNLHTLIEGAQAKSATALNLLEELNRANIVATEELPDSVVSMNRCVRFTNDTTGQVHVGRLVYPRDFDDPSTKISILSPAGAALLGLSPGDKISWELENGQQLNITVNEVF